MKSSTNILFPTDFSEISNHALDFAANHAAKSKGKLLIIHIVDMPFSNVTEEEKNEIDLLVNDLINHSKGKLNSIQKEYEKKYKINIQTETYTGESIKAIQRAVHNFGADLIIMGTKADKNLFFKLSSFNVVKNTSLPLITVSLDSTVRNFKTLLFPFNENTTTLDKANDALQFAKLYKLKVIFLGITDSKTQDKINIITSEMMHIKNIFDNEKIQNEIHFESSENYAETILNYCNKNSIDIVCIANERTNLLKGSFTLKYNKKVIKNAHIPVLTIPVWKNR